MKLESQLQHKHGMLHIAPLLDVIMLLLVFFVLNSNYVLSSGIEVTPPISRSVLEDVAQADIVSVSADSPPRIFLNDQEVTLKELETKLKEAIEKEGPRRRVLLRGDRDANYGAVMDISNMVMRLGVDLDLGTNLQVSP